MRQPYALAALTAAMFAVHAPPAGPAKPVVVGDAPLAGAPGRQLRFRLPDGFSRSPGRPGVWDRITFAGPVRCRAEAEVTAEASRRGVRFDPATSMLDFRLGGRRTLRVAARSAGGGRETWRGPTAAIAVAAEPVEAVARFPGPGDRSTLVRVSLTAHAETSSPVQRTPRTLATCSGRARRVAPALLDAVLQTSEVTTARRGAP